MWNTGTRWTVFLLWRSHSWFWSWVCSYPNNGTWLRGLVLKLAICWCLAFSCSVILDSMAFAGPLSCNLTMMNFFEAKSVIWKYIDVALTQTAHNKDLQRLMQGKWFLNFVYPTPKMGQLLSPVFRCPPIFRVQSDIGSAIVFNLMWSLVSLGGQFAQNGQWGNVVSMVHIISMFPSKTFSFNHTFVWGYPQPSYR